MSYRYTLNEGSITLPDIFIDRSINIFAKEGNPEGFININISRDVLELGETLEEYVERQISLLKQNIKPFKLIQKITIPLRYCGKHGIEIETHHKSNGKDIYQRQCGVNLYSNKVLVFTITNMQPFTELQVSRWRNILDSFAPTKYA